LIYKDNIHINKDMSVIKRVTNNISDQRISAAITAAC